MAHRIDRIWLLGGVVVTLLLAVASWFIVIHPTQGDTTTVQGEVADGNLRLTKLRHQLADLDAKQKQLPALLATLKANQGALPPAIAPKPAENSQAAYLNQLHISDIAVGVTVNSLTFGAPVKSTVVPSALQVPITLAVEGTVDDLSRFVFRLQNVQARAVLINSVSLSADTNTGGTATDTITASIGLTAFETSNSAGPTLSTK